MAQDHDGPPDARDAAPVLDAEARWRLLFENVPYVITEIDPEGRILLTNLRSGGLGAHALVGTSIYDRVPERLRAPLRDAIAGVVASGVTSTTEARIPTPGGDTWWLTRLVPVKQEGQVQFVVAIAVDITARKTAERLLRESEERLALALEAAEDGVWDWDVASGHTIYSARWAAMLGYEPSELAPHFETWRGLVHPDDMPRVAEALVAHLRGASDNYEVEHRLRTKSDAWKWVLTRGKVVAREPDGRPRRITGTHKDVDVEKRASSERERLIAELQDALDRVRTLSGLLPICGSCKKIRDDEGYWRRIEAYISEHTGAQFSHGLCPQCADALHAKLRDRYGDDPDDDGT